MNAVRRLAGIGVGVAMLAVGAAHGADAATPTRTAAVTPDYTACHMTITHPAEIYAGPSFSSGSLITGKHTGQGVTSAYECSYFVDGFHQVNTAVGDGYIYASDLGSPSPRPPVASRYQITGTVNVRNAPSTTRGRVLETKWKGQIVTSPVGKDDFDNNGFAEVLMGNGNVGWISSAYVR